MPNSPVTKSLTFYTTHLGVYLSNNTEWVSLTDIALALGYQNRDKLGQLFLRHQDEFDETMTKIIRIGTPSKKGTCARVFSRRGAHLLAMFARTEKAKAFRRWVLDVLGEKSQSPQPPALVNSHDQLLKTEIRKHLLLKQAHAEIEPHIRQAMRDLSVVQTSILPHLRFLTGTQDGDGDAHYWNRQCNACIGEIESQCEKLEMQLTMIR